MGPAMLLTGVRDDMWPPPAICAPPWLWVGVFTGVPMGAIPECEEVGIRGAGAGIATTGVGVRGFVSAIGVE